MEIAKDTLLHMLRRMVLIREFEEMAGTLMEQARTFGSVHLYVGEEGVQDVPLRGDEPHTLAYDISQECDQ